MMKRWEVAQVHWSAYSGLVPREEGGEFDHEYGERLQFRSFLGADFWRRFRVQYFAWGFRGTNTVIVRPGTPRFPDAGSAEERRAWYAAAPVPPRYMWLFDRAVWPALYWLRSRWDGLRYGMDRDAR